MTIPNPIAFEQLELGAAGYFAPEVEDPPANQVNLRAGFLFTGAREIRALADQSTPGFAVVSGGTVKRWDLVYLDRTGVRQIQQGTEVPVASSAYQGAPGWVGGGTPGPVLLDMARPVAWVLITETAAVVIDNDDITWISGLYQVTRELDGYWVDKGALGSSPTGNSIAVTAMFVGETAGDGSVAGIVTSPPNNVVGILDHKRDELIHTATGSVVYGRIQEAAGTWTLPLYYTNASGSETAIGAIETDCTVVPTNLRLASVLKMYARTDPSRPLSVVGVRVSDQVAGDMPYATTSAAGKVELATNVETTAGLVLQASDSRLPTQLENDALVGTSGAPSSANKYVTDADPRWAGVFTPAYYYGTFSATVANADTFDRVVFAGTVLSAGVSLAAGTGVFTVTAAGKYRVSISIQGVTGGGNGFAIKNTSPATGYAEAAAPALATSPQQFDQLSCAALLDLGASGTFEIVETLGAPDGTNTRRSQIVVDRIA